ncbi:hypothetical protein OsJ_08586 [Oryza sativa Japonica Group]|uniref:Uncharacterized protein n=1 Tax=Oryza sativa subsp. japonica TaxID=39947 RepID=B9F3I8_ORYSJ|nr:hypothetical protein OsJ_08586 [Oryza sativa Japonica Group]
MQAWADAIDISTNAFRDFSPNNFQTKMQQMDFRNDPISRLYESSELNAALETMVKAERGGMAWVQAAFSPRLSVAQTEKKMEISGRVRVAVALTDLMRQWDDQLVFSLIVLINVKNRCSQEQSVKINKGSMQGLPNYFGRDYHHLTAQGLMVITETVWLPRNHIVIMSYIVVSKI